MAVLSSEICLKSGTSFNNPSSVTNKWNPFKLKILYHYYKYYKYDYININILPNRS